MECGFDLIPRSFSRISSPHELFLCNDIFIEFGSDFQIQDDLESFSRYRSQQNWLRPISRTH